MPGPQVITLSTPDELRAAVAVHHAVHGDPEPVWEEFLHHHPVWAAPGAHRAVIADGRIVALTSVAMWRHRLGTTTLPSAEIGLVGTLPEHRNRGHSRALMEGWLATMRAEGVPLSFLIGIPGFYERWDYHYAAPDHANHFLAVTHDPLRACAAPGAVRDATVADIPAIAALIAAEQAGTPLAPVLDEPLLRYFLDRAEAHGVAWRVVEGSGGAVAGVVRYKRWGEGIGPQAPGAVTLVAAREDARPAVAAELRDHLLAGHQGELPLAIAPHGPFARWLHLRGALRKCDRSIYPGGYAAMVRVNDLMAVLEVLRGGWDEPALVARHAGTALTLRVGREAGQVATVAITGAAVTIAPGDGGVEVGAPPAVTMPWLTGWRSAADWLDGTPYPPLPGPEVDPGDPAALPHPVRELLRALFPARHPYIGDTIQGA